MIRDGSAFASECSKITLGIANLKAVTPLAKSQAYSYPPPWLFLPVGEDSENEACEPLPVLLPRDDAAPAS